MRTRIAAAAVAALATTGVGDAMAADFAGPTKGISNAPYIGISVKGDHVVAYVCNGDAARKRRQTIGEWFRGTARSGRVVLRSRSGARLVARLVRDRATGTVRLAGGRTLRFAAKRASGRVRFVFAALPRTGLGSRTAPARDGRLVAGWIRLANGSERGTNVAVQGTCEDFQTVVKYYTFKQKTVGLTQAELEAHATNTRNFITHCTI